MKRYTPKNKKSQRIEAFIYHSEEGRLTYDVQNEFGFKNRREALKRLTASGRRPLIWTLEDRWYHLDRVRLEDLAELVWTRSIKRPTRRRAIRYLNTLAENLQYQEEE